MFLYCPYIVCSNCVIVLYLVYIEHLSRGKCVQLFCVFDVYHYIVFVISPVVKVAKTWCLLFLAI